jgi:hypothetical protein
MAAADFEGGNKLGLAVTLTTANGGKGGGFVVILGNGNGTFQAPKTFSKPIRPIGIAAGPLTKGGYPGIAVTITGSDDIALFYGDSAGGFEGPSYVDLPGDTALAIGDLNGDGIPDLVSSGAYIAFGKSDGEFTKAVSHPIDAAEGTGRVVALADLRNNGLTDIVTLGNSVVSVLLSEGKGEFEDGEWITLAGATGCGVTGDFNGDGKPDLAVNTPTGLAILLGTGKAIGPFTLGETITLANAGCPVAGDLNGDGIPDLLVQTAGSVVAYLGNGAGSFTLASTTATPTNGFLTLADFNHDGKLDFASSGNLLALGNGDGTFKTPTAIMASPPSSGFSSIASGDINNDGWPDLALTNYGIPYNNVFVLLNNHHGGFTQVPTDFGALTTQAILADMNGDGNLDLIIGAPSAEIYLGNGKGDFTFQVTLHGPDGAEVGYNCVADINGDGIPDVIALGFNSPAVYLGEGDATYAAPFYIGVGPSPGQILVERLHGQAAGLPDILAPDGSGGITVLLNLTK